jgi:hypothetical protein
LERNNSAMLNGFTGTEEDAVVTAGCTAATAAAADILAGTEEEDAEGVAMLIRLELVLLLLA